MATDHYSPDLERCAACDMPFKADELTNGLCGDCAAIAKVEGRAS